MQVIQQLECLGPSYQTYQTEMQEYGFEPSLDSSAILEAAIGILPVKCLLHHPTADFSQQSISAPISTPSRPVPTN